MAQRGRPIDRPPTLEVVAARAGVSRATASRVLRGATNVSDDAREAVLAAARETAYAPNRAARSLVTRRSDSVAFLVAESEDRLFNDPYFLAMLRGAHAQIAADGLPLMLERMGVPTVINGRPLSGDPSLCYVDSDNLAGARLATELLLERGARHVATIT